MKPYTLILAFASLLSCLVVAPAVGQILPDSTQWTDSIIHSSLNPTKAKIVHNLTVIDEQNKALVWKTIDGKRYVKMVTFKSAKGAGWYNNGTNGFYNTQQYYIWVSAAPAIQEFCQTVKGSAADINNRMEGYLGLQPESGHDTWIEFWVQPKDLFRPCPDNEITDNTCDLCLPENAEPWYRQWFNETRAVQYGGAPANGYVGYPWTQLGYTYDWASGNGSIIGGSEFVIRANADVVVIDKVATKKYCK